MPEIFCARATARSTLPPTEVTVRCLIVKESDIAATPERSTQKKCPNSTCCAADFPARLSALLEAAEGSETPAAPSFLSWPDWLKPGSLAICSLRMFPACYRMTAGGRLQPSSIRWTDWGMVWSGKCSTAKVLASPSPGAGCILSDILMPVVEEKYYLSPSQQERLLCSFVAARKEAESTTQKE